MDFEAYGERVEGWISRNGGFFPPFENLARLVEETGELSRAMAARMGRKRPKPGEVPQALEEEIGDILFVVFALARQMGVDAAQAAEEALRKAERRDAGRFEG